MKNVWILCLFSASFFFAISFAKNFSNLMAFLPVPASYYAKEYCSCRFVLDQKEPFCKNWVKSIIPPSRLSIDVQKKTSQAIVLWKTASARYYGEPRGCELQLELE